MDAGGALLAAAVVLASWACEAEAGSARLALRSSAWAVAGVLVALPAGLAYAMVK